MVSLNLYQYRAEVKQAILALKGELEQEWDPFIASWVAYALACDGVKDNLLLTDVFNRFNDWVQDTTIWQARRNLCPLAFLVWLQKQLELSIDVFLVERIFQVIQSIDIDDKLSPLRHAEQVFLLALGFSISHHTEGKEILIRIANDQMRGTLARQILYAASLRELGSQPLLTLPEPKDTADIIALLWWKERYLPEQDKSAAWRQFANIKDTILLSRVEDFDTRRILSPWELALLYEAIVRETSKPDPNMLFDYYPLHPRIRAIAETDFKQGNYFGAVFEACKTLEDFLKTVASATEIGVALVKKVLGDPNQDTTKKPLTTIIKLNPLDSTSSDYKSQIDEQKGYASLGIGIFQAFRNPKGHQPKDKTWVGIDAYEALDQLVTVSAIIKRIEKALSSKP